MQRHVLIVAGGKGLRMGTELPKQFLLLDGKPVIIRTLEKFLAGDASIHLVVVVPTSHVDYWSGLKQEFMPDQPIDMVIGGETRFESVRNGLNHLPNEGLVAIHDAVRPYISPQVIAASFQDAAEFGSGVVCVPLKDSIRRLTRDGSQAEDRTKFRLMQTPQTFDLAKLKQAFAQAKGIEFSDDATVFEAAGFPVHLTEGHYDNFKITTPEDLR
jgi:2-C-methyl-D-erythritol 4-phosphate cytidylyltransferase